jgi:hypothetical protein
MQLENTSPQIHQYRCNCGQLYKWHFDITGSAIIIYAIEPNAGEIAQDDTGSFIGVDMGSWSSYSATGIVDNEGNMEFTQVNAYRQPDRYDRPLFIAQVINPRIYCASCLATLIIGNIDDGEIQVPICPNCENPSTSTGQAVYSCPNCDSMQSLGDSHIIWQCECGQRYRRYISGLHEVIEAVTDISGEMVHL